MREEIQKNFFLFEIIASELVSLNCLLRRGYFSSADNVLTRSPKICQVNKADSFQRN